MTLAFEITDGDDFPAPRRNLDDDAAALFDYLVSNPDGVTWEDVERELAFPRRNYFFRVVRRLRATLGDDEISVVCDPRGMRETWLYRIVGNPTDAAPWQENRLSDMESRLETILNVSTSVARNTDGRTLVGRKARRISSTIGYLLGELANLRDE